MGYTQFLERNLKTTYSGKAQRKKEAGRSVSMRHMNTYSF